ncbi:PIN domain-containing protein [Aquipuribacter nitratireducens]|uniref:PIN domain-containing protein n=1 Tax=Aquipuribacter nitratireducens TaxID=650104 RepID=A0ABW0GKA9_9MICO
MTVGIDTNVLVRYLAQDDPHQAAAADVFMNGLSEQAPGFVSLVTVLETYWVLTRSYGVSQDDVLDIIDRFLTSVELEVEGADVVRRGLRLAGAGADFSDALIAEAGRAAGCSATVTFDRRAASRAGMVLLDA